jgi:transketolase
MQDGPTHQPVEHLASFRAMPNIYTMRPCAGTETAGAYKFAVEKTDAPTVLALSRQGMAEHAGLSVDGVQKGAYIVDDCDGEPTHILMGTGTEVGLCIDAKAKLQEEGHKVRQQPHRAHCTDLQCAALRTTVRYSLQQIPAHANFAAKHCALVSA